VTSPPPAEEDFHRTCDNDSLNAEANRRVEQIFSAQNVGLDKPRVGFLTPRSPMHRRSMNDGIATSDRAVDQLAIRDAAAKPPVGDNHVRAVEQSKLMLGG